MDGLTIMLRVFIILLCFHTMPNNHYCSTYMMPYPHLMAKHCLTIGRKSGSVSTTMDYRSLSDIVYSVNTLQRLSLYIPRSIYLYSLQITWFFTNYPTYERCNLASLINSDPTVGSSSRYLHIGISIGIFTKQ